MTSEYDMRSAIILNVAPGSSMGLLPTLWKGRESRFVG